MAFLDAADSETRLRLGDVLVFDTEANTLAFNRAAEPLRATTSRNDSPRDKVLMHSLKDLDAAHKRDAAIDLVRAIAHSHGFDFQPVTHDVANKLMFLLTE